MMAGGSGRKREEAGGEAGTRVSKVVIGTDWATNDRFGHLDTMAPPKLPHCSRLENGSRCWQLYASFQTADHTAYRCAL